MLHPTCRQFFTIFPHQLKRSKMRCTMLLVLLCCRVCGYGFLLDRASIPFRCCHFGLVFMDFNFICNLFLCILLQLTWKYESLASHFVSYHYHCDSSHSKLQWYLFFVSLLNMSSCSTFFITISPVQRKSMFKIHFYLHLSHVSFFHTSHVWNICVNIVSNWMQDICHELARIYHNALSSVVRCKKCFQNFYLTKVFFHSI